MVAAITILGILATVAFGLSSHYKSTGLHGLAFAYLVIAIFLSAAAVFLVVLTAVRKVEPALTLSLVESEPSNRLRRGEKFAFGVYWDSDLNPLCPVCKTPLTLSTKNLMYPIDPFENKIPPPQPAPHCLKCNEVLFLYDDAGKYVTLGDAKKQLTQTKPPLEALKSPPPEPQTTVVSSVYYSGATVKSILDFLNDPKHRHIYAVEIGNELKLTYAIVCRYLEQLKKDGYVVLTVSGTSHSLVCDITPNGREFIALLDKPRHTVPLPNSDLTQIEKDILKTMAFTDRDPTASNIAQELELSIIRVEHDLTNLKDKGYVSLRAFQSITGRGIYALTQQGRAFLLDRHLI